MESMSLIVEVGILLERGPCMSLEVFGIQRHHRLAALCLPESVASSVKPGKSPLPCKFVRVRVLTGVRMGASAYQGPILDEWKSPIHGVFAHSNSVQPV